MSVVAVVVVFVVGAALAAAVMYASAQRDNADVVDAARAEASTAVVAARRDAASVLAAAEAEASHTGAQRADTAAAKLEKREARARSRIAPLERRERAVEDELAELEMRADELRQRNKVVRSQRDRASAIRKATRAQRDRRIDALEAAASADRNAIVDELSTSWIQDARREASHAVRAVDQAASDPSYGREAQRLLQIAVGRYRNHFLTERNVSTLQLSDGVGELLTKDSGAVMSELTGVSNIQLNMSEDGRSVRMEGLDGVGREVTRRALGRLNKRPQLRADAVSDPHAFAHKIRVNLEREIFGLGKKAFKVLRIETPHDEIVQLVGALNYRTSYTQNQWLHAVEASFLAGMIASEIGLDIKLMRRATLMHDIGKALTHKIEGSHAVIGADIARRLGEDEIVANAIGSHHADEPPNSAYAFIVAGADAMSGARPGARREHEGGYSTRLEDMERIGQSYRGVEKAFAVHGGRELRVYVEGDAVSDLEAVELSSEIAEHISDEMTFPGQIKVTVIRASEAVAVAG